MVNKPIYLWPAILVYRIVTFIIKVPILFVRYFCLGLFFTCYILLNKLLSFIYPIFKYSILGLLFVCYIVYQCMFLLLVSLCKFIKYFTFGLVFPFVLIYNILNDPETREKRIKAKQAKIKNLEKIKKTQELKRVKEEKQRQKLEEQNRKKKTLEEKKKHDALIIKKKEQDKEKQEKLKKIEKEKTERLEKIEKAKQEKLAEQEKARLERIEKKEKIKEERLEKLRLRKEKRLETIELRKKQKEEKKQARLDAIAKKKEDKLRQIEERKLQQEKAKQEKLEQQIQEKEKTEEIVVNEEESTNIVEKDEETKVEEISSEPSKEDDGEYIIHSNESEILNEEKEAEQKDNYILSKDERKRQKLERIAERKAKKEAERLEKQNRPKLTKEEKRQLKLDKIAAKKEAKLKKAEAKKKQQEKMNDFYINENIKIEKQTLGKKIMNALNNINNLPDKISQSIQKSWNNSSFVKNKKNRQDISRQALLINFEGEDAVKSDKKVVYEYVGKNADGKLIKGYFEAFSKVEVHSFLLSEGFEVYSIKTSRFIQFFHGGSQITKVKIKTKDLIFFLTQLSTYIKAGIPLVDALKILSRQYKNKTYQRIFRAIIYDLTMGENFSDALSKQGNAFPKLLINMIKASEMTGELPEALDDMADYYTETDKTRKQMITAMMYPSIIFIISIAAVTFIMVFVVPKFVTIYESMDSARLPWITQLVIDMSQFLETKMLYIVIVVVSIGLVLYYLYKKAKIFRTFVQFMLMHLPGFGKIIIYNEITMFTKTFCSLLRHNVFITDSMEILNKITNNEIYKMIILDTITNLARGEKISLAFKDHWAVPLPAYEMIVTGERTGQLPEMMGKVSSYYQEMHKNAVTRIKTFIEPALILFLTFVVGGIVLSIVVPMFDMYNNMGL